MKSLLECSVLIRNLPCELRDLLKKHCVDRKTTMNARLIELIRQTVQPRLKQDGK